MCTSALIFEQILRPSLRKGEWNRHLRRVSRRRSGRENFLTTLLDLSSVCIVYIQAAWLISRSHHTACKIIGLCRSTLAPQAANFIIATGNRRDNLASWTDFGWSCSLLHPA